MPHFCAPACQSNEPTKCDSTAHSPISILNDDTLLNIFYLYQLGLQDTDVYEGLEWLLEDEFIGIWKRQRWWYKLAHVSQLWRHIILASPSKLDLHLICTHGVPVGDMLTHSPSLPLIILYTCEGTTKDEEASILLALLQHDRVRRIALRMPAMNLEKLIQAMDKEYPILERLYIECLTEDSDLMLPEKFRSPNLRLIYSDIVVPIRFPLLPCTGDLVCLWLVDIPQSVHLSPHEIHIQLSSMPQLEILGIALENSPDSSIVDSPITPVTLPNLILFLFIGGSTYLESLLSGTSVPDLSALWITLCHPLDFPVPHLMQFIQSSKSLIFKTFELDISGDQVVFSSDLDPELDESMRPWYYGEIEGGNLGQQVASAVQILGMLSPMLSAVEKLTFSYTMDHQPAGLHGIDRMQLRGLLRPFSGVKTLHVQNELVRDVSRSLCSEDGEPPVEILPNLEELSYSGSDVGDIFTRFINERQAVGHTVTVRLT